MEHTRQKMEMLSRLAKGAYKTHNELGCTIRCMHCECLDKETGKCKKEKERG